MKKYIKSAKTIEDYQNMGVFDTWQMYEIRRGLAEGLDVSLYADPKYADGQMQYIREGLEQGLDVSWYADPKYDKGQMYQILQGLAEGLDVSMYANSKYDWKQMNEIRQSLESGLDVSQYADTGKKTANTRQLQRNGVADAKTIEDYVIYGLPDSTGKKFDVVKYVEAVNDNPKYWSLSGYAFHDKAFELFERDMERKFPGDEINNDVEAKFYDDISGYGYYDEEDEEW